jgi:uncharacterized protein (TIGR00725 family)
VADVAGGSRADRTRLVIAVVGPGTTEDPALLAEAYEVGAALARAGVTVVTGGLGGVMAAACRGARSAGGLTVGLLPGSSRSAANAWVDVAIPTDFGEARNVLVVRSADVVVAVGGSWGTMSEVALATRSAVPVVALHGWRVSDGRGDEVRGPVHAATAGEAVAAALSAANPESEPPLRTLES